MIQGHVSSILALDVGERRIGVAIASLAARLPRPLTTVERGPKTLHELQALADAEQAGMVIVGLPRNLSGNSTAQTVAVEDFAAELKHALGLPVHWQDEAVTSRQAEAELQKRGKPYTKGDIDALSATYILEDFLRDNPEVQV
jgi:putative holliday junction resolvase